MRPVLFQNYIVFYSEPFTCRICQKLAKTCWCATENCDCIWQAIFKLTPSSYHILKNTVKVSMHAWNWASWFCGYLRLICSVSMKAPHGHKSSYFRVWSSFVNQKQPRLLKLVAMVTWCNITSIPVPNQCNGNKQNIRYTHLASNDLVLSNRWKLTTA